MGAGWLLFLPAAVLVMVVAAVLLWRKLPHAQTRQQRYTLATTGSRLGMFSGLLLAPSGLGLLGGPGTALGLIMIGLGLSAAAAGYAFQRHCTHVIFRESSEPLPRRRTMRSPG